MSTVKARKPESWKIFDDIAPTYDFLNHFLSLGIDVLWRKNFLRNLPNKQDLVAYDLATGTGDVALALAKDSKIKTVTGIDLSVGMLEYGKQKVKKNKLENKIFMEEGDGVTIPKDDNSADVITVAFGIRNFPDPQTSLINMVRVLRNGGRAMIMEFSLPKNFIIRFFYLLYFRHILPAIGNAFSKNKDAYTYLNESVEDFPYGKDFTDMMVVAGMKNVRIVPLSFGIASLYIGDVEK
ncbi:MAG: bifunctional demethylmenaquinone methyltransferase/2-methoxy-6-polyprenyl-1,4-benzoquinol methylase UbiE [Halobacteriovorax sp.]|nr:bifunctional demethylmenaquinone methyltransferase/2-methoxy-6-polyprenyl-1,4-benzoquinol methylase UbiE [Halobacteriovorax sp.]|tara:strand:- start:242027 stop:242740 length:714 start_codon:yes stop_codon:yes gene_type:complete